MKKKITALYLTGVVIIGGALFYPDKAELYVSRFLTFLSSAAIPYAAAQSGEMPAPQVPVAEVVTRKVALSTEFTGHLEASRLVELRPRVGGAIETVSVPEGELVQSGQALFEIDARPFQVVLDAAKAELQQAEVLLEHAETNFKRTASLAPNGTVSRKTFDDAQAARSQRKAQVAIAKATVAAAELDLSFTRVTAPVDGRVDRVLVHEGNLVTGGNAGNATLLTTIVSTDPLYVYFDIDETTYLSFVARAWAQEHGKANAALPVQIALMTDKEFTYYGALDFLSNRIDRRTGTIRARAVVENPEGILAPGLFARIKLATSEPLQTVLIDDQAIGTDQGRRYVLVLGEGNKAEFRPVEIGTIVDGLRVISSGLQAGEKIIVKGLVGPGMQVTPQMISMVPERVSDSAQAEASQQEVRR
ncbi:efflux RND transporter periplasmic adaptor subunit [Pseudochrobactrum sp. sp1633]|uniref:efflux RND transporter periplasmic adaptor subunit n=1 Tax=Pseudochrobactrum sp. sp1633 TaxID=3036706 RepID=UPI0025A513DD|nr:efflux RND transporter periplasmic adaptor subunit [Pseudochrobactrum sp. sp1633]MDM8346563.1 efflux RND transporter periplasmic adaptor subunit [Pseudochrobactrum sp. sp1633]HWD12663.1 efflux RND transporter periplasmic adaptor subunit [Pseudochrobactrum sp.]